MLFRKTLDTKLFSQFFILHFKCIKIKSRVDEATETFLNYKFTIISKFVIMSKFRRPYLSWLIMLLATFPLMKPQNTYEPLCTNKSFLLMTQTSDHCSLSAWISCSTVTYKFADIVFSLEFFSPSFVVLKVHALGLKVQNLAFDTEISTSFSNLKKKANLLKIVSRISIIKTCYVFCDERTELLYII